MSSRMIFVCDGCGGDILGVDHVKVNTEIHQVDAEKCDPATGTMKMKKPVTRVFHFHNECSTPDIAGKVIFQEVGYDLGVAPVTE